ncbi:hypothetical protein XI09_42385 [Bradyrhizobium sp. CCBAU 11386]|nr:hypothetical protein [Bradyrhizobium sp. CCBAU 11386]
MIAQKILKFGDPIAKNGFPRLSVIAILISYASAWPIKESKLINQPLAFILQSADVVEQDFKLVRDWSGHFCASVIALRLAKANPQGISARIDRSPKLDDGVVKLLRSHSEAPNVAIGLIYDATSYTSRGRKTAAEQLTACPRPEELT